MSFLCLILIPFFRPFCLFSLYLVHLLAYFYSSLSSSRAATVFLALWGFLSFLSIFHYFSYFPLSSSSSLFILPTTSPISFPVLQFCSCDCSLKGRLCFFNEWHHITFIHYFHLYPSNIVLWEILFFWVIFFSFWSLKDDVLFFPLKFCFYSSCCIHFVFLHLYLCGCMSYRLPQCLVEESACQCCS